MLEIVGAISSGPQNLQVPIVIRTSKSESAKRDVLKFLRCQAPMASVLTTRAMCKIMIGFLDTKYLLFLLGI